MRNEFYKLFFNMKLISSIMSYCKRKEDGKYIWMASCASGLTHILPILRKNRAATQVQDKTKKYKLTQKGNNINDQMV